MHLFLQIGFHYLKNESFRHSHFSWLTWEYTCSSQAQGNNRLWFETSGLELTAQLHWKTLYKFFFFQYVKKVYSFYKQICSVIDGAEFEFVSEWGACTSSQFCCAQGMLHIVFIEKGDRNSQSLWNYV